jgi:hypothetical protein
LVIGIEFVTPVFVRFGSSRRAHLPVNLCPAIVKLSAFAIQLDRAGGIVESLIPGLPPLVHLCSPQPEGGVVRILGQGGIAHRQCLLEPILREKVVNAIFLRGAESTAHTGEGDRQEREESSGNGTRSGVHRELTRKGRCYSQSYRAEKRRQRLTPPRLRGGRASAP